MLVGFDDLAPKSLPVDADAEISHVAKRERRRAHHSVVARFEIGDGFQRNLLLRLPWAPPSRGSRAVAESISARTAFISGTN